jgi:aromatic ring-opening dioxygenase catalytic subunit (LigB family)
MDIINIWPVHLLDQIWHSGFAPVHGRGETTMTFQRLPTLMINHGGGPCFSMAPRPPMPPGFWDGLGAHLHGLGAEIGAKPKAVLVISAHWETPVPTVHEAASHSLFYDYYNFPEHTYRLTYPVLGAPAVAARTRSLLEAAGIETAGEAERGLDHGVFIPFMLIYPEADVPIVQLSLRSDLSPERHLEIGRALTPLRDEGVLIVGSGLSYHNFGAASSPRALDAADAFDAWLTATVTGDPLAREAGLVAWSEAPGGRMSHPREEHLLPLMVAAGAAEGEAGRRIYSDRLGGRIALSGYRFG